MAVRLVADLRPSADGSAVRTWLGCRQPACLYPRLGQTDGRSAVSLNAPPPTAAGIIKSFVTRTRSAGGPSNPRRGMIGFQITRSTLEQTVGKLNGPCIPAIAAAAAAASDAMCLLATSNVCLNAARSVNEYSP